MRRPSNITSTAITGDTSTQSTILSSILTQTALQTDQSSSSTLIAASAPGATSSEVSTDAVPTVKEPPPPAESSPPTFAPPPPLPESSTATEASTPAAPTVTPVPSPSPAPPTSSLPSPPPPPPLQTETTTAVSPAPLPASTNTHPATTAGPASALAPPPQPASSASPFAPVNSPPAQIPPSSIAADGSSTSALAAPVPQTSQPSQLDGPSPAVTGPVGQSSQLPQNGGPPTTPVVTELAPQSPQSAPADSQSISQDAPPPSNAVPEPSAPVVPPDAGVTLSSALGAAVSSTGVVLPPPSTVNAGRSSTVLAPALAPSSPAAIFGAIPPDTGSHDSSDHSTSSTLPASSPSTSSNKVVIAVSSVGGVATITLVAFLIFLCLKKRKASRSVTEPNSPAGAPTGRGMLGRRSILVTRSIEARAETESPFVTRLRSQSAGSNDDVSPSTRNGGVSRVPGVGLRTSSVPVDTSVMEQPGRQSNHIRTQSEPRTGILGRVLSFKSHMAALKGRQRSLGRRHQAPEVLSPIRDWSPAMSQAPSMRPTPERRAPLHVVNPDRSPRPGMGSPQASTATVPRKPAPSKLQISEPSRAPQTNNPFLDPGGANTLRFSFEHVPNTPQHLKRPSQSGHARGSSMALASNPMLAQQTWCSDLSETATAVSRESSSHKRKSNSISTPHPPIQAGISNPFAEPANFVQAHTRSQGRTISYDPYYYDAEPDNRRRRRSRSSPRLSHQILSSSSRSMRSSSASSVGFTASNSLPANTTPFVHPSPNSNSTSSYSFRENMPGESGRHFTYTRPSTMLSQDLSVATPSLRGTRGASDPFDLDDPYLLGLKDRDSRRSKWSQQKTSWLLDVNHSAQV